MSSAPITPRDALMRLGASTAEAIAQVLEMFAPGAVERGDVTVLAEGASPFSSLQAGAVAASVSYVDGVTGGNIFVLAPAGARRLAEAMGVPAPEQEEGGEVAVAELSELELSAVSEAANQMMAAAASAIGMVLGHQIEISPPETRVLNDPAGAEELYGTSPHACSTTFLIGGESCRLIQLVPNTFVVRLSRALEEGVAIPPDQAAGGHSRSGSVSADGDVSVGLVEALSDIKLRVWAELGRTHRPLASALGLSLGAVVELDRPADAPVDLFVNGVRFAQGHLLVTDEGEWALCLDEVGGRTAPQPEAARGAPDPDDGRGVPETPLPAPQASTTPEPEPEGALT